MKKVFLSLLVVSALVIGNWSLGIENCFADVPGKINYQGKLTDASGQLIDGTHSMSFTLFTEASGGGSVWTETHGTVTVTNGLFNVMLGSTEPLTTVFQENNSLYLEIAIGGETLSPRQEMASVGYAIHAATTSSEIAGGWTQSNETWTRTGDFTFTVPGDQTAIFQKGTRIKYKQGGAYEYGTVISSVYDELTTVTLATNDDYAMAAEAITDNYYSYSVSPQGYPGWFNYTPTYGASGDMTYTSVTTTLGKFSIVGNKVCLLLYCNGTTGGVADKLLKITPPVAAASVSFGGGAGITDAGNININGVWVMQTSTSIFVYRYDGDNWDLGANGRVRLDINYAF